MNRKQRRIEKSRSSGQKAEIPSAIQSLFGRALALHEAGKFGEAQELYRQILAVDPNHADTLHLTGVLAHQLGRNDVAFQLITRALEIRQEPLFFSNLGNALKGLGRAEEAVTQYKRALSLNPNFTEAYTNLGVLLREQGKKDESRHYFQQAFNLAPDSHETNNNMGIVFASEGKPDEAIECFRKALAIKSDYADAHFNLGKLLLDRGQVTDALACFQKTIEIKPSFVDAYLDMAQCMSQQNMFDAAISCYERAIAIRPDYKKAWNNLGGAFLAKGELAKAIEASRRGGSLDNMLLAMVYAASVSPVELADAAREYGRMVERPLADNFSTLDRNPDRKIRVGYVSPHFREHSVSFFIAPLIKLHDRNHFEVFGYSNVKKEDRNTIQLKGIFDHWRDISSMSDDTVSDLIRDDKIDILVDLAGHTGDNRLLVFARKSAPVQVTWLGFPATTGMKAIDYRVTDIYAEPEGMTEHLNVEKLWRLPTVFACYQAPDRDIPVVDHPPLKDNGYITFGCFNNFAKVTDPVLETWAKIMAQVPDSRLLLEITGLDSPKFRAETEQRLKRIGLPMERVMLQPRRRENQFVLYNKLDIALDPFPCNGGTTSFDCMWMGVPFVTLAGEHFVSRMGVTILTNAGLPELIAKDKDDYVKIATALATDKDRLRKLRHNLRDRVVKSPLMDQQSFARNIEHAYREMWKRWCTEQG